MYVWTVSSKSATLLHLEQYSIVEKDDQCVRRELLLWKIIRGRADHRLLSAFLFEADQVLVLCCYNVTCVPLGMGKGGKEGGIFNSIPPCLLLITLCDDIGDVASYDLTVLCRRNV